jgi:hypothetical protein
VFNFFCTKHGTHCSICGVWFSSKTNQCVRFHNMLSKYHDNLRVLGSDELLRFDVIYFSASSTLMVIV